MFALAALAMTGIATANEMTHEGYLIDSRGTVVRDGSGQCVHTGFWTSEMVIEGCGKAAPLAAVVTAPVAAPVAAPVPAPVVKAKTVFVPYTLQTEALFAYNKSELKEQGKQKIHDEVLDKMKEYTKTDTVVITGYADRIGSAKYNTALSQRRADAVKAYIVAQGVDGGRIETAAKGEADPVVSCDNIKGKANHKNKALISCLQPNRRIVLDIKGQMPVQK